jgi:hypothetical protein
MRVFSNVVFNSCGAVVLSFVFFWEGSTVENLRTQCQAAVKEGSENPVTAKFSRISKTNGSRNFFRWASKLAIWLR